LGLRKAIVPLGTGKTNVLFFEDSGSGKKKSIRALQAFVVGKFLATCLG